MGHMINPTSYRLGYTYASANVWHVRDKALYSVLFSKTQLVRDYVLHLFKLRCFRELVLINEVRVIRVKGHFHIAILFYSTLFYTWLHFKIRKQLRRLKYNRMRRRVLKMVFRQFLSFFIARNIFALLNTVILRDCSFLIKSEVKVSFIITPQEALTADAWTDFICHKLKKKNTFGHTMTQVLPIWRDMLRQKILTGFKMSCSGRLTRRGRASTKVRSRGAVPFSKITALVSYSYRSVILANSLCGIKVWLFFNINPIMYETVMLRATIVTY